MSLNDSSQSFSYRDISYHKMNWLAYLKGFPVINKKTCN